MSNYQPDVIEQLPAGGNPMQPESGTYGDQVALDDLAAAGDEGGQAPAAPPGPPVEDFGGGGGFDDEDDMGLPPAVMAPTGQPNVPTASPLGDIQVNPVADAANAAQKRLALLDQLANSSEVSAETRDWAQLVLQRLAGRSSG